MGVYSKSSLSTAKATPVAESSDHILDLMIENAQNDMKMFDSVIELDFMQAYNEAGVISINEEETEEKAKVNIGEKIKEVFNKLIATVKQFISTFIAKLRNLLSNDAKLAKTYMKTFDSNAVGYKLKGFKPMNNLAKAQGNFEAILKNVGDAFDNAYRAITTASDNDGISSATDNLKKDIKKAVDDADFDKIFFIGDKQDDYTLTATDAAAIKSVMNSGGKGVLNSIKGIGDKTTSEINKMKSQASADKYTGKATDSSLAVAKANGRYKCCSQYASAVTKLTNGACNAASRYVAAARKAFVAAGKATTKEEVKAECGISMATYDAILCEASDGYVESALAMV